MLKGRKIRENDDWQDFVTEHPEVKICKDILGNVTDVRFPDNSENKTIIVLSGQIAYLQYSLEDVLVTYSSQLLNPERVLASCYKKYHFH